MLNQKALAIATALIWGGSILMVGILNLIFPAYGLTFLEFAASLYPGYHAQATLGGVLVGTGYGLIDGFVGGYIFAWLYNKFITPRPAAGQSP